MYFPITVHVRSNVGFVSELKFVFYSDGFDNFARQDCYVRNVLDLIWLTKGYSVVSCVTFRLKCYTVKSFKGKIKLLSHAKPVLIFQQDMGVVVGLVK